MYSLDELKQQNKEIQELCELLLVVFHNENLRGNSHVCDLINQFYDKVWMHLVFEDKTLYTDLMTNVDDNEKRTIIAFHDSAKTLKKQFGRHIKQWCHLESEKKSHHDFTEKSSAIIFDVLARIEVENKNIFPLVIKYQNAANDE